MVAVSGGAALKLEVFMVGLGHPGCAGDSCGRFGIVQKYSAIGGDERNG